MMEVEEKWAVWADDTYCHEDDIEDFLTFMSDDFRWLKYDEMVKHFGEEF